MDLRQCENGARFRRMNQKTTIFTGTGVQQAGGAAQAGTAQPLLALEAVLAVGVDVLVAGRREPGDVLVVHTPALGPELLDHGGHVDRVPGHHRVCHQVQAKEVALRPRPRWKARPARTPNASKTIELGSGTADDVAMKPRFTPFAS